MLFFTQYLKANAKMPVFKVFKKSNFVSGILWTKPKNEGKELFKYSLFPNKIILAYHHFLK